MEKILFYDISGAIHSNNISEILILFEYFQNMYSCHRRFRYAKDKERFEALFIFGISKKAIDLYFKQMICGHFSQNILVSYVRPCLK